MRFQGLCLVATIGLVAGRASAQPNDRFPVELHGFVRTMVVAGNATESFGNPNFSAITAAANPVFVKSPDAVYSSLQVQQSRFGLHIGDAASTKATFEIDFIHFDVSSPTVGAFPRLRLAQIDHVVAPGHRLFIGQGWDVYGPVLTHSTNYVANLFLAGNSGFIRQQAGWIGTFGSIETALAVGLPGSNNGPSFTNLERGVVPTTAARVAYKTTTTTLGLSGIATSLRFDDTRRAAWAGNVFLDVTLGDTSFKAEAYAGANTANLGMLTLAMGSADANVRDAGGFVSVRHKLSEEHALHLMFGAAGVLNPADMKPGYTPAKDAATPAVRVAASGPGIVWNRATRLGWVFTPKKGLAFVVEPYAYQTRHRLAAGDAAANKEDRLAVGCEAGAVLTF